MNNASAESDAGFPWLASTMLAFEACEVIRLRLTKFANADDDAWIAKCVGDNADQGQSAQTIAVYCSCMNGKMTTSETLSITAWEKTHPAEMAACDKESGWK